jgi:pSer/pThr/pTyr-binding forkhead associated (FHA) protein
VPEVYCNRCGHKNPPGSRFCSSCGAPLDVADDVASTTGTMSIPVPAETGEDDVAVEVGELPTGVGMLVVKRGPNSGSRFALDADVVTAGRHPDSDIFLDDITVSRRHAEVHRRADGYIVRDAGSLNGTYLNRERVEESPLSDGDELQIGTFKLVFLAGSR